MPSVSHPHTINRIKPHTFKSSTSPTDKAGAFLVQNITLINHSTVTAASTYIQHCPQTQPQKLGPTADHPYHNQPTKAGKSGKNALHRWPELAHRPECQRPADQDFRVTPDDAIFWPL